MPLRARPVSYTHLDVYKRQVPASAPEPSGHCASMRAVASSKRCRSVSYTHLDVYKRQDLGDHAARNDAGGLIALDLGHLHLGDEGALVVLIPQPVSYTHLPVSDILAAAITTNTFFARFDKILDRGAARI